MDKKPGILEKAFQIFECLAKEEMDLSLDEVSKRTAILKSTAFRILNQLVRMRYIDKLHGQYQIALAFLSLARAPFHHRKDIQEIARRHMSTLRDTYDESVNFALWDNSQAILIASLPSRHVFRIENQIGQIFPLHCTAIGKVIAAYLPWETVWQRLKEEGLERQTKNTITDPEKLRAQLHAIREKGFGIDNEESFDSVRCIAVPIFHSANELFGALSISGPASRMSQDLIPKMSKDLQITGYRISFDISSYYSGVSERMRGNHHEN